jgi:hypothetical protein
MAGRVAKSLDALLPGRVGGASFREHHDAPVNRQLRISYRTKASSVRQGNQ